MRTATLIANLLSSIILAATSVYVQVVLTDIISLPGRISLARAGSICLIAHLVVCLRSHSAKREKAVW